MAALKAEALDHIREHVFHLIWLGALDRCLRILVVPLADHLLTFLVEWECFVARLLLRGCQYGTQSCHRDCFVHNGSLESASAF